MDAYDLMMRYWQPVAFLVLLGLGLHGWWGLMTWPRGDKWWMRTAAILCFLGLTGAGRWMPEVMETSPSERIASERIESEAVQTLPDGTVRFATDRRYLSRYEQVSEEIGPPPHEDAVPVLGYTTSAGLTYPARWRMPPNADATDNLKQ